ncbi:CoB--CoM heterodisulfide reductase iron-sulfur subunit A family protein, partial [bacterium]|nr:CoB--CoM heterodisulfide reductase iron-sulfur subunit A family protein [candidate division CSSED10-310 bacterium]
LFPSEENAKRLIRDLIEEVVEQPLLTLYTNASVLSSEGIVGDFVTRIQITPRGVNETLKYAGNAIAACPEETFSEYDYGLVTRKAIYMPYPGCYPQMAAIDWGTCTKCGKCVAAVGGKGIDLNEKPVEKTLHSGVIILATGYDPYEPTKGEYGYGIFPRVVTLQQLNRLLDEQGPTGGRLTVVGDSIKSIGFIHCAGARQRRGIDVPRGDGKVNEYCARTCCTASLHAALKIKELYPRMRIYDFYQDIRTYGRGHEEYYERASESGVIFLRYDSRKRPKVLHDPSNPDKLIIRSNDLLTGDIEVDVPVDMVVLATGVVPHDISELVDMFKCAVGHDSFLLEVHPKLRPVELAVSGVFLAGTCQGPMDVTESCAAAAAAASKASALIAQGQVEMDPFIAEVDELLCTGCQTCLSVCPYDAISKDQMKGVAVVNDALCTGCGTCVAACPSNAISQYGFTDKQILSEVEMLLSI